MASLEVPNSTGTNSLLARLIGSDEMETNVTSNGAIISRKGTIRGVQDSVKNTIQNFKKMKAKPDASPMLRRAMEVNITILNYLTIILYCCPCRLSARTKWTGSADRSSFTSRACKR